MALQKNLDSVEALKETFIPFKANLPLCLGIPAIQTFVPLIFVGLPVCGAAFAFGLSAALAHKGSQIPGEMVGIGIVGVLCFAVLYNAIRAGWTKVMLSIASGEQASFGDLMKSSTWMLNFVILGFIIGVGTAIGTVLFVVPGIIFAVRTCMAPFLLIDENLGPIEALVKSNELVTGQSWQIFIYFLAYGIINFVAGSIPLLGIVLSVAVMGYFDLALCRMYLQRTNRIA